MDVPVYCDFAYNGGGWTLLLTASSRDKWSIDNILGRNVQNPSLNVDYSILGWGDSIKALAAGDKFRYRIEARSNDKRQQYGGIWLAPTSASLASDKVNYNTEIVVKFNEFMGISK